MKLLKNSILLALILTFVALQAIACATDSPRKSSAKAGWKTYFTAHAKVSHGRKPAQSSIGLPDAAAVSPWGGNDPKKWTPEASLANWTSHALNDGFTAKGVSDVLVSVPAKMLHSANRPYGDGQTNASLNFGSGWSESEPALVSTLIRKQDQTSELRFRFHRSLKTKDLAVQLTYYLKNQKHEVVITATREAATGDLIATWNPSLAEAPEWGTLFQNQVAFVKPKSWDDWFPVDFRNVAVQNSDLLNALPDHSTEPNGRNWKKLSQGTLLDPELVSVQALPPSPDVFPFLNMKSETFGSDIHGDRYFPVEGTGIHNEFPGAGASVTAVGHGNTLVMKRDPSNFKSAYICFDKRNLDDEQTYHVPSGGGWHEIGDPAETVINSLESGDVVFGYANGQPAATTPDHTFAYGLTDVIVVRKLAQGYGLVTASGDTTALEEKIRRDAFAANKSDPNVRGTKGDAGRNYHWFIFDQPHEVCAVEWVHVCVPKPGNQLGFSCSADEWNAYRANVLN